MHHATDPSFISLFALHSYPPPTLPNLHPTMTIFQPGFIYRIQHPILSEEQPGNSADFYLCEPNSLNRWRLILSRAKDLLTFKVIPLGSLTIRRSYIHVIPMNGGKPIVFDFRNKNIRRYAVVPCKIQG